MIIIIFNIIVTNTIVINNNEFSSVLTASEPTRRSDFTVGIWKADPYCKLQWRDWIKAIFATQDWLQSYPVNNSLGDIEARGQGSSCQHNQHWSISREQSLPLRLLRSKHTWFGEGCAKKEYQMSNIGLEGSYIFSLISSVILMEKMRFLKRLHGFKLFHFAHF